MDQAPHDSLVLENRHTGERLELRRVAGDGETWLELRGSLPPHRDGPPLHVHHDEDEGGRVKSGTLSALVDGRRIEARPGEELSFPRGSEHRWWNEGDETLAFEGFARPVVDLDRYLQAAFEVINAGPPDRPPLFYITHVAWRHRRTQTALLMPRPMQAVLFPIIVLIGTLLGRYRGTEWPGCPTKCLGAPVVAEYDL